MDARLRALQAVSELDQAINDPNATDTDHILANLCAVVFAQALVIEELCGRLEGKALAQEVVKHLPGAVRQATGNRSL